MGRGEVDAELGFGVACDNGVVLALPVGPVADPDPYGGDDTESVGVISSVTSTVSKSGGLYTLM